MNTLELRGEPTMYIEPPTGAAMRKTISGLTKAGYNKVNLFSCTIRNGHTRKCELNYIHTHKKKWIATTTVDNDASVYHLPDEEIARFICSTFINKKIRAIKTRNDITEFAVRLIFNERCNVHCDDDFSTYIGQDGKPTYTHEQAQDRNRAMQECFHITEDPYRHFNYVFQIFNKSHQEL